MKKAYGITMLAILVVPMLGVVAAGDEARKHAGQTQISGFGFYDQIGVTDTKEWAIGGGSSYYLTDFLQIGIEGSVYHNEVQIGSVAQSAAASGKAGYYYPPAPVSAPSSSSTPATSAPAAPAVESYSYETVTALYWHGDVCITAVMPTDKSNPFEPYAGVLAGIYFDDYNRDYSFLVGAKAGINTYVTDRAGVLTEYRYMRNTKADENEHYVEIGIFYLFM